MLMSHHGILENTLVDKSFLHYVIVGSIPDLGCHEDLLLLQHLVSDFDLSHSHLRLMEPQQLAR